jgi:phosphonate transport system permease protein
MSTTPPAIAQTPLSSKLTRLALALGAAVLLAWAWRGAEMDPVQLWTDRANMGLFLEGFARPDFTDWPDYLEQMVITLQIAIWGTLLSVIAAVPLGLLSSGNLAPAWVRQPVRRLMDASRAVNEMIFAMLFISAVGLGPFAGVLAIASHTVGVLAKLFSEAVEAIDPRPVEGVRAVGATRLQEIVWGVLPQVLPLWISYILYRFESNVRSASVVGMVGAGGIGMVLWDTIRSFAYGPTAAILLLLVAAVTILDLLSARVRRHFL